MRKSCIGLMVLCASAVVAAAPASVLAAENVRTAVEAGNKQFVDHFGKGDAAGVAALYTDDAQVLPPNGEPVTGQAGIQKFWQGVMTSGVKGAKLTTVEAAAAADTAWEVGRYELSGADGKVLDGGKYVVVWKRVGGRWKLHRDIWNTSRPPAR